MDIKFSNFDELKELIRKGIKDCLDKSLLIPKIEKKIPPTEAKPVIQEQVLNLEREKIDNA